ncbi:type II toxin-antitoxin system VapC family toxin [Candidatus Venteria ishoeyi]|uniref:Ribonuclease VapC n=1 Tax=Candidatus Venteria ishoeyi TaxID=1899563 RepID=A0A1H6FA03_9GAMM|nr:type II toxin-antitoxin system VapC family toxin [Candidatus Venteria ishoeyi]MDM8547036.1 type II toxin-antitoxin system VapC family toxin [Candidatus Venteria ishoeyi]SEH06443.1 tRNA(fMet)-specific endonuclease VapC [Candidatus Venteria ishoeyi]
MFYIDTSFIAPLFINEATSDKVAAALALIPPEQLALSLWTKTEFYSLTARRVRMRELEPHMAKQLLIAFEQLLKESCRLLVPGASDFHLAAQFIQDFESGLRAGDALHLAIMQNHACETLFTLDKGMAEAAKKLGLLVST